MRTNQWKSALLFGIAFCLFTTPAFGAGMYDTAHPPETTVTEQPLEAIEFVRANLEIDRLGQATIYTSVQGRPENNSNSC